MPRFIISLIKAFCFNGHFFCEHCKRLQTCQVATPLLSNICWRCIDVLRIAGTLTPLVLKLGIHCDLALWQTTTTTTSKTKIDLHRALPSSTLHSSSFPRTGCIYTCQPQRSSNQEPEFFLCALLLSFRLCVINRVHLMKCMVAPRILLLAPVCS